MPFYEYVCEACGKDFALLQSMAAKVEDTICPYCSEKKAKKTISKFSSKSGDSTTCGARGFSWGGG